MRRSKSNFIDRITDWDSMCTNEPKIQPSEEEQVAINDFLANGGTCSFDEKTNEKVYQIHGTDKEYRFPVKP